ncbi:hypothetical protein BH11MYX4_BH11MYX4_06260 [soil metagenome]
MKAVGPGAKPGAGANAIVVGTDFSPAARNAVARAALIARETDATLHVVHALAPLPLAIVREFLGEGAARPGPAIDEVVSELRTQGVSTRAHEVRGPAAAALGRIARDVRAALVVVGARGRNLPDAFVGSTAERTCASARLPVLLVRRRSSGRAYRNAVIAVDLDSNLRKAFAATRLVAPRAATCVLHAYPTPFESGLVLGGANLASLQIYRAQARREAREALGAVLAEARIDPTSTLPLPSDPRVVIDGVARDRRDALVVLDRGRSRVLSRALGSVGRWVIAHGTTDVLLI